MSNQLLTVLFMNVVLINQLFNLLSYKTVNEVS